MQPPPEVQSGTRIRASQWNALVAFLKWLAARCKPLRVTPPLAMDGAGTLRLDSLLKFVQVNSGGIAARSGTTVSSASCTELAFNGTNSLTTGAAALTVYNPWNTAAPASKYALAVYLLGAWWLAAWDCS